MSKKKKSSADLVSNRKALHDFEIIDSYEAGIVLKGTEIKSLRDGGGSLQESYVRVLHGEIWLIGAYIATYRFGNLHNHEERRTRKLLMHKKEIAKLKALTKEKGYTLVALGLYLVKGKAKLKVGLAKGRKHADKRHVLKEKDEKRRMQRAMKSDS